MAEDAIDNPLRAAVAPASPEIGVQGAGFGLYLHWPFCAAKCPYCDFNSHVARHVDHPRWEAAFTREIRRAGTLTPGRALDSIFIGGGTPSLMPPDLVATILDLVRRTWNCGPELEVTLEANPSSVERGRFQDFVQAGVNRFSIGVQALDDADLRRLGRLHSVREAIDAVATARGLCERVSFDLIYARQDQTAESWSAELAQALALEPDHLSLYQLTIEDGTVFGARQRAGKLTGMPDEERSAALFELTQDLCGAAGLPAYEISNHARRGAEGRHNLVYWRYGDFLGLGPGAHGRLTRSGMRFATLAEPKPEAWLAGVEEGAGRQETTEPVARSDQAAEYLMMCLRLREGASVARHAALSGVPLASERLERLADDGLIWRDGDRFGTTRRGRLLLNAVLREIL